MTFGVGHGVLAMALIGSGCGGRTDLLFPTEGEQALASAGSTLQGSGPCAAVEQIDRVCPPGLAWDTHGQYVACVTRYLDARVASGDISAEQHSALVAIAAHSSVGKGHDDEAQSYSDKWGMSACDADSAGGAAGQP